MVFSDPLTFGGKQTTVVPQSQLLLPRSARWRRKPFFPETYCTFSYVHTLRSRRTTPCSVQWILTVASDDLTLPETLNTPGRQRKPLLHYSTPSPPLSLRCISTHFVGLLWPTRRSVHVLLHQGTLLPCNWLNGIA